MDQTDRYDPDAFDFLGPPFAVPVRGDLLLTVPQEDALSGALNAFGRGVGLVLIAGEAGSGRTLVADALADSLRARGVAVDQVAQIGGPGGGALLARVARLLGIAPGRLAPVVAALAAAARGSGPDVAALAHDAVARGLASRQGEPGVAAGRAAIGVIDRERWGRAGEGRHPAGEARPGRAPAVVVDDAGTWPDADLLLLVSLVGLRVGDAPLLRAVLVGDAALVRRVATLRDAAAGTMQAADGGQDGPDAVSLHIRPLTLRQGEEYLAHRIAAAGGSLQRTMSPGAIEEILLRCGGNPGRIDRLADDCLAITASRRRRTVTATVVRTARQAPRQRRRLSVPLAYALLGALGGALAAGAGLTLALHGWSQPVPGAGGAPGRGDPALFAGAGRFGAPDPATQQAAPVVHAPPRPYRPDYPAQGFAPPVPRPAPPPAPPMRLALAPAPVAPLLPGVGVPSWPTVPPLPVAAPATIRTPGLAAVAGAAPPVLPPAPASPAAARPVAEPEAPSGRSALATVGPPSAGEVAAPRGAAPAPGFEPLRTAEAPLPVPPELPARPPAAAAPMPSPARPTPSGRRDGPVVSHVARGHDTTAMLLRRIWGADDPTARALFRSLNPGIDAQGPWPSGTVVTVPQRLRGHGSGAAAVPPEPPRAPEATRSREPRGPRSRDEVVRDNPAGQQRSGVPYFCRSILPQNGAEDAYTRQVCGR